MRLKSNDVPLKDRYEAICELYVERFLRKHGFFDEEDGEYSEWEWVNSVGGIVEVGDYYIGFGDILLDIDELVDKDMFFSYYDYITKEEKNINYSSFIRGAR